MDTSSLTNCLGGKKKKKKKKKKPHTKQNEKLLVASHE